MVLGLFAWFLAPWIVHGYRLPVGPDAPVYLWWARLSALEGLSAAERPGVPALTLVLQGTLHVPSTAVLSAVECVLGVWVGVGTALLVRSAHAGRALWLLAAALAGTFAVHLATGYVANLVVAALFLAAAALLAERTWTGAFTAAGLLGASGLAHPAFTALASLILLATAALGWRADRAEAARIGAAVGGGAVVALVGLASMAIGPSALRVDTSRDAFLRRAGLTDILRAAYRDRLVKRWARYVQWAAIPLALAGLGVPGPFLRRLLWAWGAATVAGVALGAATGWFPPDRFITFGYVVPILAAFGLERMWRALGRRRWIAALACGGLVVAMLAGAMVAWWRQAPFVTPLELARVTTADRFAAATPAGTALVFVVQGGEGPVSFLATRAGNVIRAGMPPDRIRDVLVLVPPPTAAHPGPERAALSLVTAGDVSRARRHAPGLERFILAPFDRPGLAGLQRDGAGGFVARGVWMQPPATPRPAPVDPLRTTSPAGTILASLATLALLLAVGLGWGLTATRDRWAAIWLAPALGTGALILVATVVDRLGLRLHGSVVPTGVSALAGLGGYLLRFVRERRARPQAPA